MEFGSIMDDPEHPQYDRIEIHLEGSDEIDELKETSYGITEYRPESDRTDEMDQDIIVFSVLFHNRSIQAVESQCDINCPENPPDYETPPVVIDESYWNDWDDLRFVLQTDPVHNDMIHDMDWEETHHDFHDHYEQWVIDGTRSSIKEAQNAGLQFQNLDQFSLESEQH